MSNKKMLEFLERNVEGLEKIAYFIQCNEELTCGELMVDIEVDHFKGYECFIPMLLLSSDDPVISRTNKRLFLHWFREDMEARGTEAVVNGIVRLLQEEHERFETRRTRLEELKEQNKL